MVLFEICPMHKCKCVLYKVSACLIWFKFTFVHTDRNAVQVFNPDLCTIATQGVKRACDKWNREARASNKETPDTAVTSLQALRERSQGHDGLAIENLHSEKLIR